MKDFLRERSDWLFIALASAVAMAYAPGLGGGFVFDDYPNLAGLSAIAAESSPYSVMQYVLNGISSTLGRPLSLLSFAAQAGSWDDHADDFIRVNILLHLVNGALWYALLRRLQRLGAIPATPVLPLFACALWLVLPVHASAVLYVVQRMVLLATTCTLIGFTLYVSGREAAANGRTATGYLRMTLGFFVATILGTLAKETAAVAPLLFIASEGTLLRDVPRPPGWRRWSPVFLWLPAALLAGYLCMELPAFIQAYDTRTFTLGERLLTEPRMLALYLAHAYWPATSVRILYDDLTVSSSLLQPWSTVVAALFWLAAAIAAVALRKSKPVLSFAVAWYLIGHLIESSFIPLELAFDHRSYLPLLGIALGMAWAIAELASRATAPLRSALAASAVAYVALLGGCLWLSASLWGNPLAQAKEWVARQPESRRAVHHYGSLLVQQQRPEQAQALYDATSLRWKDDPLIALSRFELGCFAERFAMPLTPLQDTVRRYRGGDAARAAGLVDGIAKRIAAGSCPHLAPDEVLSLLDTMAASSQFVHLRLMLYHASAMLLDAAGRKHEALDRLDQAIALDPQVPLLQQAVLWSLQLGDVARAKAELAILESPTLPPRRRWTFREEIAGTRQLLKLYEALPGDPPS